ncbi:DUF3761 domain-containing protein [Janthinobacterium agaricidamnosum]|uniref:DUF3761 domain-containing protein n=1 Tax=Janthinobacterium agaricidamnosum TaxID=55508 RepID=UPI0009E02F9F|nr:DUF3761 domain-containing protein [Janthinobacterium agaricidamnosum]
MNLRRLLVILLLVFSPYSLSSVEARDSKSPAYAQKAEPNEADLQQHGHYRNKDGEEVHSPAKSKTGKVPQGASALCRDGSYSFSKSARGTCSHHGGVASWL